MTESSEMNAGDKSAKSVNEAETVQTQGEGQEKAQSHAAQGSPQNTIDELQKRVEELEKQVKEKESKYLYLYADFDNFKRRSIKERSDLIKFGCEPIARELLQNIDDMERALEHIPGTDKNLRDGLTMILNQLKGSLAKQGVQPVASLQKPFDPNFHEAIGQEESDLPSGTIVKEHTRGYTIHGRLLRPARVAVSSGRPNQSS